MEIIFITGKGGVGKSAVAAAYAYKMTQSGKKTLLVELGDQSFYQDYFNLPVVAYNPVKTRHGFEVALWSGPECLREYAMHLIKIESLYKLFFENPVTKALINVAPGLAELAILGKITSGPPRNVGPKLNYDVLVVDGFASGHFTALLKAPAGMAQTVSVGPMGDQSRSIAKVLSDPKLCKYFIVALPEELPVVEGIELSEQIEKIVAQKPQHILNRFISVPEDLMNQQVSPDEKNLKQFQIQMNRIDQRQSEIKQHYSKRNIEPVLIGFIQTHNADQLIQEISKAIKND